MEIEKSNMVKLDPHRISSRRLVAATTNYLPGLGNYLPATIAAVAAAVAAAATTTT